MGVHAEFLSCIIAEEYDTKMQSNIITRIAYVFKNIHRNIRKYVYIRY